MIVVSDGRIAAAGKRSAVAIPSDAKTVDAAGKFVIPGLMDANVHLVLGSSIEFVVRYEGHYEDLNRGSRAGDAEKRGHHGVRLVGAAAQLLNVRDRVRKGDVVGSRMFVAGNIVGFSGPFGREFNRNAETTASKALVSRINAVWEENVGPPLLYMTPDEVRVEIRKYLARGIDFLKYGVSTHNNLYLQFSPEAQKAIVEETHRAHLIAQTHTTNVMSLKHAIDAGDDMLQHCDVTGPVAIPDALLDLLRERNVYCADAAADTRAAALRAWAERQ